MSRSVLFAAVRLNWCAAFLVAFPVQAGAFPDESTGDIQPQVLALDTEFLPYQENVEEGIEQRLTREMVRQAILLAARDELGLATRDMTLRETLPHNAIVIHLRPIERADRHGKWHVKLFAKDADDGHPLWEKTYDFHVGAASMYADMIPKLEADTRSGFLEALRAAGIKGSKPKLKKASKPSQEIEALLMKVDFVAQFGAVRAAHRAIRTDGETAEWLGVLARGYANLAALTAHCWNSSTEVFTARSWLYAQRMVVLSSANDMSLENMALVHRAYAWALGGALQPALADLELVRQHRGKLAAVVETGDKQKETTISPLWTALIRPYCMCDRDVLATVANDHTKVKPWATYLRYGLARICPESSRIFDSAVDVKRFCPTAYGVDAMRLVHPRLSDITRQAGLPARTTFGRLVPQSLQAVPGVPDSIKNLAARVIPKRDAPDQDALAEPFPPSPLPILLARQLREEAARVAGPDPSWSTLAGLIEEEQFLLIMRYFADLQKGTGHAHDDQVEAIWPLVKDHRFAPFIESFRYDVGKQIRPRYALFKTLNYVDARRNMYPMTRVTWGVRDEDGRSIALKAHNNSTYNYTLPAMAEYIGPLIPAGSLKDKQLHQMIVDDAIAVAPQSDLAVYFACYCTKDPTQEQLRKWEKQTIEFPGIFSRLGILLWQLKDREGAERCFRKSLESTPTRDATIHLAKLYADVGERDQWQQTLLAYLNANTPGRWHREVRRKLVQGYVERGQWHKAKAHVEALEQTRTRYSFRWAELIGEGLAEWRESERLVRENATTFPEKEGSRWYFWCRRTGRGDVAAARLQAEEYFALRRVPRYDLRVHVGVYRLLELDNRGACTAFRHAFASESDFASAFMVAQLSRELGDETTRRRTLNQMMKECIEIRLSGDQAKMNTLPLGSAILDVLRTGDASEQQLRDIDDLMRDADPPTRCMFAYFLAKELDTLGKMSKAEAYWRRSLFTPILDIDYRTLSGMELVKRHRKSRADDDVLDETDLWLQPAKTDDQ